MDVGDKCDLCKRHDFLPQRCSYCALLLCTEHIPPPAHLCLKLPDDKVNKPQQHGLGKIHAAMMKEVTTRFDSEVEVSNLEHYAIKVCMNVHLFCPCPVCVCAFLYFFKSVCIYRCLPFSFACTFNLIIVFFADPISLLI